MHRGALGCLWAIALWPLLALFVGIGLVVLSSFLTVDLRPFGDQSSGDDDAATEVSIRELIELNAVLASTRIGETHTLLPDGRVLIAGGGHMDLLSFEVESSAETVDPATGRTEDAGDIRRPRSSHSATLLSDGRVLLVGGDGPDDLVAEAEVWDAGSNAWAPAGSLGEPRKYHSATLLPDGRVLVIGGDTYLPNDAVSSAEIWDPAANEWQPAGLMAQERRGHSATLLPDGRVLVVGGIDWWYERRPLASAEIWDPTTMEFSPAGALPKGRYAHTATVLSDGRVLIIGGFRDTDQDSLRTALAWSPSTYEFSPAGSLPEARMSHTATGLPDGRVLVIGGEDLELIPDVDYYSSVVAWTPEDEAFVPMGSLGHARSGHQAILRPDGTVLVLAGHGEDDLPLVEIYEAHGQ